MTATPISRSSSLAQIRKSPARGAVQRRPRSLCPASAWEGHQTVHLLRAAVPAAAAVRPRPAQGANSHSLMAISKPAFFRNPSIFSCQAAIRQGGVFPYEPLVKLFVVPECLYRGYGFFNREKQIPAQNRCGNDGIGTLARASYGIIQLGRVLLRGLNNRRCVCILWQLF